MLSPASTHAVTPLPTGSLDLAAAQASALDDGWYSLLLTMGRWAVVRADAALVVQSAAALLAKALEADFSLVAELAEDQTDVSSPPRRAREQRPPIAFQTPADDHQSLVSRVVTAGHPISIVDLTADSQAHDPRLLTVGGRGLILCPLRSFDQSFGALGVLTTKPRDFRQRETMLVEVAAHFITTTIAQHRIEQALVQQRASSELLLSIVDALAIVVTSSGRMRGSTWPPNGPPVSPAPNYLDRSLSSALLAVEEVKHFEARAGLAHAGRPSAKNRRLGADQVGRPQTNRLDLRRARTGRRKSTILCSGIDVTELARGAAPPPPASSGRLKSMPGTWKRFAAKSPGWRARLGATADRRPSCNWATTAATSAALPNAAPIPTCNFWPP